MTFSRYTLLMAVSFLGLSVAADSSNSGPALPIDKPVIVKDTIDTTAITYSQYPVLAQSPKNSGDSGYYALHNGSITVDLPTASEGRKARILEKLQDSELIEALIAHEDSLWRSTVITQRKENLVKGALEDHLLLSLAGTKKISIKEITSLDFYFLHSEKAVVVIDKSVDQEVRKELDFLAKLFPVVAEKLAVKYADKALKLTKKELISAIKSEAASSEIPGNSSIDTLIKKHLSKLSTIKVGITHSKNRDELLISGKSVKTSQYAPDGDITGLDGSWLTDTDLENLAQATDHTQTPLKFLKFTKDQKLEDRMKNSIEINWLRNKLGDEFAELSVLYLIYCDDQWISCFISKTVDEISLVVADSLNKDRQKEAGILMLKKVIKDGLNKAEEPFWSSANRNKAPKKPKKTPKKESKDGVSYEAPLANVPLEELPSLADLFGGEDKIPNAILMRLSKVQGESASRPLLLYGPPGTGKSTIAHIIATTVAGENIVYAGGGDFRTAYQGSGKAKLEALFNEAKRLVRETGNKCVVFIDEIDGTTSQLQPQGSTQEDNRAMKAFISTLDQNRENPDIIVMCTSNYPDKMDPAVVRRFTSIEVPLPDFRMREKIISYHLQKNGIPLESGNPLAMSPDFYDKFINITDGFSGDAIGDMIVTAADQSKAGLKPEHSVSIFFRFNGIDFAHKSFKENIGKILLLPAIPAFHMIGDSFFDQHVYSQYRHHCKKKSDIELYEWQNDPKNRYGKYPLLKRLYKRNYDKCGEYIENAVWLALGSLAVKTVLKKPIKDLYNWATS